MKNRFSKDEMEQIWNENHIAVAVVNVRLAQAEDDVAWYELTFMDLSDGKLWQFDVPVGYDNEVLTDELDPEDIRRVQKEMRTIAIYTEI